MSLHNLQAKNQAWLNRLNLPAQPHPDTIQTFWKPFFKVKGVMYSAVVCQWFFGDFTLHGVRFRTAEHAMMYGKAKLFKDEQAMRAILQEAHPSQAKSIGRQVQNFKASRWDEVKVQLVKEITQAKFTQNDVLKQWLLDQPEDTLFVETSPYDAIWGIKMGDDHPHAKIVDHWLGENLLGFIVTELMQEFHQKAKLGLPIEIYKG